MMRRRRLLAAGVLGGGGPRFDYYVDSVNGNDANAGTSPGTAKKTIGALPSLAAGDKVGLACGSHFDEQFTISANNVTVGTYGTGASPVLDCSSAVAAAAWSKTGGRTNVYQATVHIYGVPLLTWVSAWEDNTRMVRVADAATCDATANSYTVSDDDADADITLYVHASDNSNPGASGKVYEYSARPFAVYSYDVSGVTLDGITTRRNLHNDGSMKIGRSSRITNCNCNEGSKHNILVRDGCYLYNVICTEAYYDPTSPSHTYFVYNETNPASLGVTFDHCQAVSSAFDLNGTGFYGHISTPGSGDFGTVTFDTCSTSKVGAGISGISAVHVIKNCTFAGGNIGLQPMVNTTVTGGSYTSSSNAGACRGVNMNADNINLTMTGFTMTFSLSPSGGHLYGANTGLTVSLTDCTFVGVVNEWPIYLTGATALTLSGVYFNNTSGAIRNQHASSTMTSDYNRFWRENLAFNINGRSYSTVTAYRAGEPQDTHSTIG